MSEREFLAACERRGWKLRGVLGYVEIGKGVSVSRFNAGPRLRDQLAYLVREERRHAAELGDQEGGAA